MCIWKSAQVVLIKLFTVCEVVDHSKVCRSHRNDEPGTTLGVEPVAVNKSSRYSLESYSDSAIPAGVSVTEISSVVVQKEDCTSVLMGAAVCASGDDLEQCVYCLQDFPVTELIDHVNDCPSKDMRNKVSLYKGIYRKFGKFRKGNCFNIFLMHFRKDVSCI